MSKGMAHVRRTSFREPEAEKADTSSGRKSVRKAVAPVADGDLGFGTNVSGTGNRLIDENGSFNVERSGLPFQAFYNIYHSLMIMPWTKFIAIVLGGYLVGNIIFAFFYVACGDDALHGWDSDHTMLSKYWTAFFFSAQTVTTVGYGHIAPNNMMANILAALESLIGLLAFALATGLLYGKFSRPTARIIFSDHALISPYQGGRALMFRMANARSNQLIDTEVLVVASQVVNTNGKMSRSYDPLKLERKAINFFPLSWTVVHPIDAESPLWGMDIGMMEQKDVEILIQFKGIDDTFAQTVHARSSYKHHEIRFGGKFRPIYNDGYRGKTTVLHLDKIDDYDEVSLPEEEV